MNELQQGDASSNMIIPQPADSEELEKELEGQFLPQDEWEDIDIDDDWLDVTEAYQRPKWTLAYDGVPFAPLGGIHALTGQPGHGKTMTFTQLMVAVLKGNYGKLTYELGIEDPEPKVLYIDTEMEKGNTQLVNLRVYSMMGWEFGVPQDRFRVIMLRETENAADRWRKTLKAINTVRPTVAFIDGLLDVVNDFNDNEECQEIIYKCMKTASHYGMSLWCLVHENPGSTKMVGHIGSILERKVTDAFGTLKDKDPVTGDVTFTVKQKKARGKDMQDWCFKVIDDSNHFGTPQQTEAPDPTEIDSKVEENMGRLFNIIFDDLHERYTTGDLEKRIFSAVKQINLNNGKGSEYTMEKVKQYFVSKDWVEVKNGNRGSKLYIKKVPFA